MKWGAHQVDGRIAANNAVKIRAALRNSIDAKKVFEEYQLTQPNVSDNQAQDRARARSWAMLHVQVDNSAIVTALQRLWAEMWVAGDLSAAEAIEQAKEMKKADAIAAIDWDTWKPGDLASSLLLQPPKAFKDLLDASGVMIQGLDKTGYERVGTALADSIRLGLSPNRAAKLINEAIGDAARALTIAITESSRAMNAGAINRYKEAKLKQMEWMTVLSVAGGSSACEICAPNAGQQVEIGQAFNSGSYQPPAHPHCRCTLLPVIPDYSQAANQNGVVDIAPQPVVVKPSQPKEITSRVKSNQWFEDHKVDGWNDGNYSLALQSQSLYNYQGSGYARYNNYLRGLGFKPDKLGEIRLNVKGLDDLFTSAPALTEDVLVFRGVSSYDAVEKIIKDGVGSVVIDQGFVSTSLLKSIASDEFGGGAILEITVKSGAKVVPLNSFMTRPTALGKIEAEVLLNRGSKFKITEIKPVTPDSPTIIRMELQNE
jgi:SPP1 gp7 family putative phage head morphogenesis protein